MFTCLCQLLALTIQQEKPELETEKNRLLQIEEEKKIQLAQLEETLLEVHMCMRTKWCTCLTHQRNVLGWKVACSNICSLYFILSSNVTKWRSHFHLNQTTPQQCNKRLHTQFRQLIVLNCNLCTCLLVNQPATDTQIVNLHYSLVVVSAQKYTFPQGSVFFTTYFKYIICLLTVMFT